MQRRDPIVLIILDGFGYCQDSQGNALIDENNSYIRYLFNTYPSTYLNASGQSVGLPKNMPGNSQAGHLAIGTGQLILQPLSIMNEMIKNKSLEHNQVLVQKLLEAKQQKKTVHIMGLASDGNVHGSIEHMLSYITIAQNLEVKRIVVHPFLDGRDTLQQTASTFLKKIDSIMNSSAIIGSIHGRFYAMDRDANQDRVTKTYDTLTQKANPSFTSWHAALDYYYAQNLTDEYIPPTLLAHSTTIQPNDLIIHTNIRPERSIELLEKLSQLQGITIISSIEYETPVNTIPLIKNPIITNCLKTTLHNQYNLRISTIAETEKWAHVTYFFDGYCKNKNLSHETRIHIPSIKIESYAQCPQMCAPLITKAILHQIELKKADFCVANYANLDMVGHTGDFNATVAAVKIINHEIALLYKTVVQAMNGTMLITGDHGNAEEMLDKTERMPSGKHTANPVPFIVVSNKTLPSIDQVKNLTNIASYIESLVKSMH